MLSVVVVLYKIQLEESKTLSGLAEIAEKNAELFSKLNIIVYDNSPTPSVTKLTYEALYVHDERNLGIATAYNYARKKAEELSDSWLMLLDHDTELTLEYVANVLESIENPRGLNDVVSLMPTIIGQNGKVISPKFVDNLYRQSNVDIDFGAISGVTAINSCCVVKVDFLNSIEGFSTNYPLDMLDHWLFYKIRENNKKCLLINSSIKHDLSVLDYEDVSINRYRNIIKSEWTFYKEVGDNKLIKHYKKKLWLRALKHLFTTENKQFFRDTCKHLRRVRNDCCK